MTDIYSTMAISARGMMVQGIRSRVIAENIANANTAAPNADATPYTRKIVTFKNAMDREAGVNLVGIGDIVKDKPAAYPTKFMPNHPAADLKGYVRMPNVNTLIEMNDMREAQRSYEANLGMIENTRNMMRQTISLLS